MATSPEPVNEPEVPLPPAGDEPSPDRPIEPEAVLPPETVNAPQEDEDAQAQTVANAAVGRSTDNFGLEDSTKVSSGDPEDDVQDLVDHMQDMVRSGRIDMGAFRDERNDDDEDGALGPSGDYD